MTKQEEIRKEMEAMVSQWEGAVITATLTKAIIKHLIELQNMKGVVIKRKVELPAEGFWLPGNFRHPNWLTKHEFEALMGLATEPLIGENNGKV